MPATQPATHHGARAVQTEGIDTDTSTGWAEPNERTAAVDAALVRCCLAADAVAVAVRGARGDVALEVASAGASLLRWEISQRGTWTFREGSWADEFGRRLTTGLLRPTLQGIARAARPGHEPALEAVVRDVELGRGRADRLGRGAPDPTRRRPRPPRPSSSSSAPGRCSRPPSVATSGAARRSSTCRAGCTLMVRDEHGRDVLFLLDGLLEVDPAAGGRCCWRPGSVVGERAAMGNGIRTATVETVTDCTLLAASGDDLAALPEGVRVAARPQGDRVGVGSS